MDEGTWTIRPCNREDAALLARELGLAETTASVLVRRGYADPASARAFLEARLPGHDPFLLGDVAAACEAIRGAVARGARVCVHGDYDVDGICATALAVLVLRELGADVVWHLPSRFDEGYGLRAETLVRLAEEGCGLVLTVDCGITAAAEVARARELGLEVVVTDHHRPAARRRGGARARGLGRPSDLGAPLAAAAQGRGGGGRVAEAPRGDGRAFPRRQDRLRVRGSLPAVVPLTRRLRSRLNATCS